MGTKKHSLIYDSEGNMHAEFLCAQADEHVEQLRKIALFWTAVGVEMKADDLRALPDDPCAPIAKAIVAFESLCEVFEARIPDDEDE